MAMVHQLPEGNMTNRDKLEDGSNTSDNSETSSRPSSRSSAKSNTPDPLPQYQYSKEELMKLSDHPYTKKRPACLDPVHVNTSGKWDPERWFISKRNEKISHFEEPRSKRERSDSDVSITHKRRTSDPKERVREERDDIVLSPQRRSFGTGCHVMQQSSLARRPGSPGDNREVDNSYREPSRRIGSGRIITRDREQRDWDRDHRERDYGYGGRNERRDRFDQDDEKEPRRFSNRFGRGRISRGRDDRIEEEEPEWFSGGPTSQSETIELVGFDDIPNDDERKNRRQISKRSRENSRRHSFTSDDSGGGSSSCGTEKGDVQEIGPPMQKGVQVLPDDTGGGGENRVEPEKTNSLEPDTGDIQNHKPDFDLDDIFKMDWFPGLIPNGTPPDRPNNEMPCSRFSQWFKRDSPILGMQGSGENSRRSSLQDELIAHVLNAGIGESQLFSSSPPSNSENYFTPISPAISHNSQAFTSLSQPLVHQPGNEEGKNILEILQNATFNNEPLTNGMDKSLFKERADMVGKAKSVEELEADLKRLVLGGNEKGHEEDKSAFNRLLQHLSDGQSSSSPSLSIGPLDKSKALQEEDLLQNIMRDSTSPLQHTQMYGDKHMNAPNDLSEMSRPLQHSQNDLISQLIQQAQQQRQHQGVQGWTVDMLAKLLGTQQSGTPSLSPTPSSVAQPGQHHPNVSFNNHNEPSLAALIHQQRQREMMNTLLKQQQQVQPPVPPIIQHHMSSSQELGPLGIPPVSGGISPRQSPLPGDNIGAPIQGRIPSPLVFGQQPPALSHAPAPIHPAHLALNQNAQQNNSNTLQVQNPLVLPRVPSPQELAVHTQSILQNALIKRKLEEQKENFRKRQEAQRTRAPNSTPNNINIVKSGNPSPPKGLSPTMAAFTPTSVMKKMHSEKLEKDVQKIDLNALLINSKVHASLEEKCGDHSLNGPQILGNSGISCSMDMNSSSPNQIIPGLSPSLSSLCTSSNALGPRAVHGQGATNHARSQNHSTINSNPSIFVPSHGRPIVKGGNVQQNATSDHVIRCTGSKGGGGSVQPPQQNKPFLSNNPQNSLHMHHDMSGGMDSVARVIEQQRLLQRQQAALAAQRQLNTSPMPPIPSGGFGLGPRAPAINSHHSGLVRPGNMNMGPSVGSPNLNLPLFRSMVQANLNNPALRAQASTINQLTQFSQLAALQQQLQRGTLDSRQLQALAQARGLHPIALQQLLLNAQTQAAAAVSAMGAASSGMVGGRADSKNQHLLPGQPSTNRQSPVNLAKWFGNDVLKQKMPDMPPVPHQKALLVEEIERQQQQSTTVHN